MAGELFINNRLIDIDQALPFPLTFNIADIRDVSARKGNKSKTITVPGTNANSAIFRSIFLLTYSDERTTTNSVILDFDPSIKATARYYNNGILEFNGIAQLQECKLKDGTWSFDLTLVSDTIDYISRMNKVKINELDFTEFNHALTKANQFETWNGFNQINGASTSIKTGTDWDGVGYYYGLIDYGYRHHPTPDKFDCDEIAPQVFVYTILKKLFEYAGITWNSRFLESQRFKKLLMAYFGGNFPTITPAQQANDSVLAKEINNASGFIVNGSNQANDLGGGLVSFSNVSISDIVDVAVTSDPIGQTTSTIPFVINAGTTGMYTVEYKGDHQLEVKFDQTTTNSFKFALNLLIFKNGTIISNDVIYQDSIVSVIGDYSNTFTFNYSRQINCTINDQIRFGVTLVIQNAVSFGGVASLTRTIELTSTGTQVNFLKTIQELLPGGTVAIGSFLPDMTGDVFLKGLITMFNLMVKPATDNPSVLEIEPLSEFYTSSQDALDWTQLVDYSQELNVQPTINYASKEYNFDFKQDADYWNTKYQNEFLDNYGEFQILSQSQYATQITKMALPFSQKPLVEGHPSLIIPASYQVNFDANANGQVVPKKGSAFIVYVGRMRSATWKYHDEFNTQHNLTEYPYVGHLDDIDFPSSDLNFGVPETVYYPATVYTNNNLIQYHNTFIQELVSRYGKLLTCYAKIDTSIINTLDFRNLININGVVYRLQKISDYDSTKERTTQIELLRLIQGEGTPREDEFVEEGSTPSPIITEVENNTIIREQ
jgi:hypothetical protein